MIEIIPTYVPRDSEDLAAGAEKIRIFSSGIHIDVDDGVFAPHLTWPYVSQGVFEPFDLASLAALDVETHLMVAQPREIGIAFARAGAMRIVGHVEGFCDPREARDTLAAWRSVGASEVGLGLLLDTPLTVLEPLVKTCDVVHMMSIATIGTQGIPFDPHSIERIAEFHERHPDILISVDGGVSESNIVSLVKAGARRFGIGSAIMKSDNLKAAYENLKAVAESAL
jgi:ribulose-phosphate 3-epimerase